jgi:hypothetical protein
MIRPLSLVLVCLLPLAACEAPDGAETTPEGLSLPPPPPPPPPPGLRYTLSAPLKQDLCAGDGDSDCLNDWQEQALASQIDPIHFLDEDEDCPGKEVYYQVRPVGVSSKFQYGPSDSSFVRSSTSQVDAWRPFGGTYYVAVSYFLNFYKDCNTKVGVYFAGHLGDNENVTFLLTSTDLRTWTLVQGHYPSHGFPDGGPRAGKGFFFDGTYLMNIARAMNINNPSIASDEDGHGSFPGVSPYTDACTGPDMYGENGDGNQRDCFYDEGIWDDGHMGSAMAHGHASHLLASNNHGNIGEPDHWNPAVLQVWPGGRTAAAMLNGVPEFFSNEPPLAFCGWNCPQRNSAGQCSNNASCTTAMWEKIDKSCYRIGTQSFGNCLDFRKIPGLF